MPDDPKTQAFLYGPLVLAGDLGSEGLSDKVIVGPNSPPMRRSNANVPARPDALPRLPAIDIPAFHATNADRFRRIKPDGLSRFLFSNHWPTKRCAPGPDQQYLRQALLSLLASLVARA